MVEQIELIANQRNLSKISLSDIDDFRSDINQVYSEQIEAMCKSIFRRKDDLIRVSSDIQRIREEEALLMQNIQEHNDKIASYLKAAQIRQKELSKKKNELEMEKQKLVVYKELKWLQEAVGRVDALLKESDFNGVVELIQVMNDKCNMLYLNNLSDSVWNKCQEKVKQEFENILGIDGDDRFTLENLKNTATAFKFFNLIDEFKDYFWEFILKKFIKAITSSNLTLEINNHTFILKENQTPIDQTSFINLSTNLIKEISGSFDESEIEITQNEYQNYVNRVMKLCFSISSNNSTDFEEKTRELIRITNTSFDFENLLQGNKISNVLGKCREMLVNGSAFGDIISEMRKMMKGLDTKGMIHKISILALVIWKDDPTKLSYAISTLATINTIEAFECAVMFEEAIQNQ